MPAVLGAGEGPPRASSSSMGYGLVPRGQGEHLGAAVGTLLGVVAFAGPGTGDLGDPRRVVDPGVNVGPRVVVFGSEGLETAPGQATILDREVHLVQQIEAVATVDGDRFGPAGGGEVGPDSFGGLVRLGLLRVSGRQVAGARASGGEAVALGVDVHQDAGAVKDVGIGTGLARLAFDAVAVQS